MSRTLARRATRRPQPTTDRQRFDAVFTALAAAGVAYWFDLRGATGVREDRYNDYVQAGERCGTDLWVGEHVGNVDCGGAYWATTVCCTAGVPRRPRTRSASCGGRLTTSTRSWAICWCGCSASRASTCGGRVSRGIPWSFTWLRQRPDMRYDPDGDESEEE